MTPRIILQILPIALAQVKAGNISENLPNEIKQIISSLLRGKEIRSIIVLYYITM